MGCEAAGSVEAAVPSVRRKVKRVMSWVWVLLRRRACSDAGFCSVEALIWPGKEFEHVFLEMFPDSASSQSFDPKIPMEDGLTIPQWWLLDWLRDQVKHDEARLAYLMDVEEEARQLNKIAIPLALLKDLN
ncbi:hypothetical protein FH972_010560 [Carpinus fangiana]|uniref:Uncharacterized protein n=1 Tax=Carpinus fangiana TaxID=176857 RepID=A0A660KNP6_9ROSI|nr:hypothetical protein FH972_010560 [Carpinus fangiana]